jgi:hypothetical protein
MRSVAKHASCTQPRLIFFNVVGKFSARFTQVELSLLNDAHNHHTTPALKSIPARTVRDTTVRIWQGRSIPSAGLKISFDHYAIGGGGGGRGRRDGAVLVS